MARNEEKQLGRLNRLWLQREREEGRVKEICSNRPRLSALHTTTDVKKWIPSIKREIEYYLEQSQLSHYSDRKIEEFQEKIESLKKEYQSHLWKLRRLDPSYKEHPWKPRGYTRKRTADGKVPSWVNPDGECDGKLLSLPILSGRATKEESDSEGETSHKIDKPPPAAPLSDLPCILPENQDTPLIFNNAKSHPKHMWARWASNSGGHTTKTLADILLANGPLQSSLGNKMEDSAQPSTSESGHKGLLGLDCYSSSDEEG
ncbi:uncharacterized protein PAF06_000718 [Gastrophryne carolinensis]